jgi:hypothetical protein
MYGKFAWRSPRVSSAAKVNNNRFLVEENLAFIGYGVDAAVVEDVEVGELMLQNHIHDPRQSCCRDPEHCWNRRIAC